MNDLIFIDFIRLFLRHLEPSYEVTIRSLRFRLSINVIVCFLSVCLFVCLFSSVDDTLEVEKESQNMRLVIT